MIRSSAPRKRCRIIGNLAHALIRQAFKHGAEPAAILPLLTHSFDTLKELACRLEVKGVDASGAHHLVGASEPDFGLAEELVHLFVCGKGQLRPRHRLSPTVQDWLQRLKALHIGVCARHWTRPDQVDENDVLQSFSVLHVCVMKRTTYLAPATLAHP